MFKALKDLFGFSPPTRYSYVPEPPAPVDEEKQKAIDKIIKVVESDEWEYSTCNSETSYYTNIKNNLRIKYLDFESIHFEIFQNGEWEDIEFLTYKEQGKILDKWQSKMSSKYKREKENRDKEQIAKFLNET